MLTNIFGRAALAMLGRGQLPCRARYFSNDMTAKWPEEMKKFLEREKIDKPTVVQEIPSTIQRNVHRVSPIISQDCGNMAMRLFAGNTLNMQYTPVRQFHARGSKVKYMDFRYRFSTCHHRSHLIIIRRQKMKKHRRIKWRKKYKCVLAKKRLLREISKEKAFRVELLTMIKRAEQFDPREYALNKIRELNSKPKELSKEEKLEELKELIRKNRYQVDYIKPKHKRPETYGLNL